MQLKMIYRICMTVWIVFGGTLGLSTVRAYDRTGASASWGYQPIYRNTPAAPARSGAYTSTFYSTSAFLSSGTAVTGGVRLGATSPGATPMESSWGDTSGDDPIGVVPNPTPVGEPTILFIFALLFLFVRIRSRFRIHFLSRSPSRF